MTQGGKEDYASSFDYKKYKDLIEGVIYPQTFTNISQGNVELKTKRLIMNELIINN